MRNAWTLTTTLLALATTPALAEQAPSGELQTITVTAEKRVENLQEVPLSISVMTGAELQEQHVQDLDDLSRQVPGLSFSNVGGEGLDKIELRGVSSDSPSPTVGIYLDDVPMTTQNLVNTGATQPKFFDIDRIEVLRGPQGTLYGAGSMGGTIRFLSKQPDLNQTTESFYSELSGTDHGGVNFEENGVVNLPLADGIAALRLGADYTEQSGWIDHYDPATGALDRSGINGARTEVAHASLAVLAAPGLTVTPALLFQRTISDDTDVFGNRMLGDPIAVPIFGTDKLVKESSRDTLFVPSITVADDIGFADLTAVTSYFWRMFPRVQDGTNYSSGLLSEILSTDDGTLAFDKAHGINVTDAQYAAIANLPARAYITPQSNQLTEEIRLASKSAAESGLPVTWTVGLYGADAHLHLSDQEFMSGMSALLQGIYGVPASRIPAISAPTVNGVVVTQPLDERDPDQSFTEEFGEDQKTFAVFGELAWNATEALKATVGARYTYTRQSDHTYQGGFYTADATPYAGDTTHAYAFTPKFALNYDLDPGSSLYANVSKGFRVGGANTPIPHVVCAADFANLGIKGDPSTFAADSLWSYEAGAKALLLDNRLSVDFAGYYIAWKNVQQHIYLPICGYDYDENAGNAQSYGTELEVKGKVTPALTLTFTGAYTHATVTATSPGTGFSVGDKLLGTPDWSASFGASYTMPLTDEIDGFVRGDWDWTGASHGTPPGIGGPDNQRPVYDLVNGSLGASFGSYEVSLFVKNLLNSSKVIQHPSLLSVNEGFAPMPLTVGVAVNADF